MRELFFYFLDAVKEEEKGKRKIAAYYTSIWHFVPKERTHHYIAYDMIGSAPSYRP